MRIQFKIILAERLDNGSEEKRKQDLIMSNKIMLLLVGDDRSDPAEPP